MSSNPSTNQIYKYDDDVILGNFNNSDASIISQQSFKADNILCCEFINICENMEKEIIIKGNLYVYGNIKITKIKLTVEGNIICNELKAKDVICKNIICNTIECSNLSVSEDVKYKKNITIGETNKIGMLINGDLNCRDLYYDENLNIGSLIKI